MSNEYLNSLAYLYSRLDYERIGMPCSTGELLVSRTRRLLRALGDPHDMLKIVHVAGTKGKGSTSAMIAAAAEGAGLRAALFTSPHLYRLEERFRVDGRVASTNELVDLTETIRPVVERLARDDAHFRVGGPATFFEITTAMALLHFARAGVDLVIFEVGVGGRLDSTNAIRPIVSVLTSISFDHTRLLGSTLAAIAAEKAGIIKRRCPVVSGVRGDEPSTVVAEIASLRHAPLRSIDRDFHYHYLPPSPPVTEPKAGRVDIGTWRTAWGEFNLPLFGEHQALNAAIALAVIDILGEHGLEIGREAVAQGFSTLVWPGRAEVVGWQPWIIVDAAHNPASASALAETLTTCFPHGLRTLVFAVSREKDHRGQLEALLPLFANIICTQYTINPRAMSPRDIAASVVQLGRASPHVVHDPAEACQLARSITPSDGIICATGSLFLAAEARALFLGIASTSAEIRAFATAGIETPHWDQSRGAVRPRFAGD